MTTADSAAIYAEAATLEREGRPAEAARLYEGLVAADPRAVAALHRLGVIAINGGRTDEALAWLERAIALEPHRAALHTDRANAYAAARRFEEALGAYAVALDCDPGYANAHYDLGNTLLDLGRAGDAIAAYDRAIALAPQNPFAHINRALALFGTGAPARAVASLERAIAIRPDAADPHHLRGVALAALGDPSGALASHERALALQPAHVHAEVGRANALLLLDDAGAALEASERALARAPALPEAHLARGNALKALGRPAEALDAHDRALALRPSSPTWTARGQALRALGALAEALACHDQAIDLDPGDALAHCERGIVLTDLGRPADAVIAFDRAIERQPELAEAHFGRAYALLLAGDYARGFAGHEWRWRRPRSPGRGLTQPLWLGAQPLEGRTLLLHWEQGLGDTLQFCRYAPLLAARGARVLLEVQAPLVALLGRLPGVAGVLPAGAPLPAFDLQCPLLSLPLACRTTLATIPGAEGYLTADPGLVADWQARLGPKRRLRVGLAWSGNPTHRDAAAKRVPLEQLIAALPESADYVCLQTELWPDDERALARHPAIARPHALDFASTAALATCLDVIVSVDTSLAHLGGALGVPTWVLLPSVPDWRWLLDRVDSPWYDSLRLYRQARRGDWHDALARVAADLGERA